MLFVSIVTGAHWADHSVEWLKWSRWDLIKYQIMTIMNEERNVANWSLGQNLNVCQMRFVPQQREATPAFVCCPFSVRIPHPIYFNQSPIPNALASTASRLKLINFRGEQRKINKLHENHVSERENEECPPTGRGEPNEKKRIGTGINIDYEYFFPIFYSRKQNRISFERNRQGTVNGWRSLIWALHSMLAKV